MAVITLNWDNTAVNASANATAQRASKRIAAVGGAYDTTGFSPANDLPKTANTVDATVTANRVYDFKIEAICVSGGPTPNDNGVKQGIVFACIAPSFSVTSSTIQATVNLAGTDITKVKMTLRKQTDDTLQATQTVNNVGGSAVANFTGLAAGTGYYLETEMYAVVDGVEVISSSVEYLNAVCGPYNVSTSAAPSCPAPSNLVVGILP